MSDGRLDDQLEHRGELRMLSDIASGVCGSHALFGASLIFTVLLVLAWKVRSVAREGSKNGSILGAKDLPSLPFKWPNGQGTEKFFDGRRAARRWRKQYGPLYSIWSGFRREIVLTTPEHVQVFFKDSHHHIKATDNNSGWLFGELLGSCVGLLSQQEWQRVRKPFEPHFTRTASLDMTRLFLSEAQTFLADLASRETREKQAGIKMNTTNDLKYCPFFMVASIFFGGLSPDQREQLYVLAPPREDLFRETFQGGINRYWVGRFLPWSSMGRLQQFQRRWERFTEEAYRESIRKGDGAIVSLWEAMEEGSMSLKQLLQTLDESLFANLDVTAHAVSWNVIDIARHTNLQQAVRLEMQNHISSAEEYLAYLAREDTLLAACILESSRLHPILPFSNPEAASIDKVVDGYLIPKNTDVIVDAFAINVDNPYWRDSSTFDPHRHLGQKDQARRYNMWRFGFGPRQCLGKNVADVMLRVIVAELIGKYKLDLAEGKGKGEEVELQADSWIGLPDGMVEMTPLE